MRSTVLGPSRAWATLPEKESDGDSTLCMSGRRKKPEPGVWLFFPEAGQRQEVAAMEYSRGGRTSDGSDSVPVELETKRLKHGGPRKGFLGCVW